MKRMLLSLIVLLALPLGIIQAQDAPPQDYAVVEDAYTALEDQTIMEAEAALDLFLNGEIDTLYASLSADTQALITQAQLETALSQLLGVAPVGERVDYRVMFVYGSRIYAGRYTWGDAEILLIVSFNADDAIDGLNFQLVQALPDDPAADYQSAVEFRLPFDGLWFAFWGGNDRIHNYHVDAGPQRHAYDFVIWKDGATYSGDGTAVTDYYAYGQTVLAPAVGTVISVVNDLAEVEPQVGSDTEHPAGNHVVIQIAEDEYLFIAHMQPGSIQVAEGDTVEAGQPIGLVGNSGNTSEPHIHIHLQNTPDLFTTDETGQITDLSDAIGLPLPFVNYLSNGEPVESGVPTGGDFVQPAP